MQEAYNIAQYMKKVVESIHVGMTENQVKGIALSAIFEKGGSRKVIHFGFLQVKGLIRQ